MARTITEIQNQIFAKIAGDPKLTELNSVSKVAIYRLFVFVVAYACWLLEVIFDSHAAQIDNAILQQKSGTPNWYKNKSLAFQYGFDLLPDSDIYDNTGYTDDEIEASKIVKYCSVKESQESNRLVIKVAGESGDDLQPLEGEEKTAFDAYLQEIKYAGVKLLVVNNPADKLLLKMEVYYDVLVLDNNGTSILNGDKPVEKAIRAYMKALPFNGELVMNDLIGYLRLVPGVKNVHINTASASAYDNVTSAFLDYVGIYVRTIPSAGYFEIETFENVSYVV